VLRVLVCSETDLTRTLSATLIGRTGVGCHKTTRLAEARLLASTLGPQVILVDRDLYGAADIVRAFREDPATRQRSIAILAWGDFIPLEVELLELGANAVLRMPPDQAFDERLARLLQVPSRQETRFPIRLSLETSGADSDRQALNLSVTGLLIESETPLRLHGELSLRFKLPDGTPVATRARVVRQASDREFGVEFVDLDDRSRNAIRGCVRSGSAERA
jgi:DNA-binding response OmpR family regulator